MLTSADLREAMEDNEQDSSASEASEELPETMISSEAAGDQADLKQLLASSSSQQQQELQQPPDIAVADAEDPSTAVASLATHDGTTANQSAAMQFPLINFSSAEQHELEMPEASRLPFKRSHQILAPVQIDEDLVLQSVVPPSGAPAETVAGVTKPSTAPNAIQSQVSMSSTSAGTPMRHQSALQGATARNQAAIAAHRARLKEHSKAASPHSTAAGHGWAPPVIRTAAAASPRSVLLAPEDSNLQPCSSRTSTPAASRQSLTRFGSVAAATSLRSAQSLSSPGASSAPLRRGRSVALPSSSQIERRSLDLAQGRPLSPARGRSSSPTLQRGASVTIAQIMKQNSRLPPLDLVPPAPVNASVTLSPLPPLRRGSSTAVPVALHRGSSGGTALLRGISQVSIPAEGTFAISPRSSSQRWSEPPPGSLPRPESVTLSPEVRRNIKLNPVTRRRGSGIALLTGASGHCRSSDRCSPTPVC